jgi:hypothetical protein
VYVEYKRSLPVKGSNERKEKWVSGDYFKYNPFNGIYDDERLELIHLYSGRDYGLFSTLAGVRDYSNLVVPVSEPKGMPDDCCEFIKEQCDRYGKDGHSHSWLTLKELRDYQNASPKLPLTGLLSPESLTALDRDGITPNEWCQGTNMVGWERRNWVEDNKTLIPLIKLMEDRVKSLMQYEWQDYDFGNDAMIRIVFWFDN